MERRWLFSSVIYVDVLRSWGWWVVTGPFFFGGAGSLWCDMGEEWNGENVSPCRLLLLLLLTDIS